MSSEYIKLKSFAQWRKKNQKGYYWMEEIFKQKDIYIYIYLLQDRQLMSKIYKNSYNSILQKWNNLKMGRGSNGHFLPKDMQNGQQAQKGCAVLLIISKIKAIMISPYLSKCLLKDNKSQMLVMMWRKRNPHALLAWMFNQYSHYGRQQGGIPQKRKSRMTDW